MSVKRLLSLLSAGCVAFGLSGCESSTAPTNPPATPAADHDHDGEDADHDHDDEAPSTTPGGSSY